MIQKKMDYSTTNTASTRFVPEQNAQNLAKSVQKATLLLFLFFITCASYAQNITIVGNPPAYYCGQVVTLQAPEPTGNVFLWQADGGVLLREVGSTGSGYSILSNTGKQVEAIINGAGKVKSFCITCPTVPVPLPFINLAPSPATLTNLTYTSSTNINQANGIQTTKNWICVSNDGSTETITVSNPSPLNIFWVVSGGAIKMGESQAVVGGLFTYTVTVATSGPNAGKGSIRAFVSDPCGTLTCDPALDWEILKNIMPDNISGPTCLRDNNVDPANPTVVYSIPDIVAGNAVYNWELYDKDNNLVDDTNPYFSIGSQVLYGNSATIAYKNGYFPSDAGNFSVKVINACGGEIIRQITVGPAKPVLLPNHATVYCVPAIIGTTKVITLPTLPTGQQYSVVAQTGSDLSVSNITSNSAKIKFNDALTNGAVEVKVYSTNSPDCESEGVLVFFNRDGGETPVITGPECITRGTSSDFSFTVSPIGQYTWSVTPALPAGYVLSNPNETILKVTPSGSIDISGTYTVTATLNGGCSISDPATFNFTIGPKKPTISGGSICLSPNQTTNYTVASLGASTYTASVNGTVVASNIAIGTPFSYTATTQDATISFTAFSEGNCPSLPTVVEAKVKPSVASISSSDLCVSLNQTPTITYTATGLTGNINDYVWSYPGSDTPNPNDGWQVDATGGNGFPFITLTLDATTAGNVCLIPKNGTCEGNQVCINVPRDVLNISFTTTTIPGTPFIIVTANAPATTQLIMNWRESTNCDTGPVKENNMTVPENLNSRPAATYFYTIGSPTPWASLKVELPSNRTCFDCFVFNLDTDRPNTPPSNGRVAAKQKIDTSIDLNVYPNPVENILNVKVPKDAKVIQTYLVDAKGMVVFESSESLNTQKIDVSKFAKGVYYLAIVTDKGGQGKKIVIE